MKNLQCVLHHTIKLYIVQEQTLKLKYYLPPPAETHLVPNAFGPRTSGPPLPVPLDKRSPINWSLWTNGPHTIRSPWTNSPQKIGPQPIRSPANLVPSQFDPQPIWSPWTNGPQKFGPHGQMVPITK